MITMIIATELLINFENESFDMLPAEVPHPCSTIDICERALATYSEKDEISMCDLPIHESCFSKWLQCLSISIKTKMKARERGYIHTFKECCTRERGEVEY